MMILGLAMDGLLHWDALGLPHVCCNSFWLELLLWKNLWVGLTMRPRWLSWRRGTSIQTNASDILWLYRLSGWSTLSEDPNHPIGLWTEPMYGVIMHRDHIWSIWIHLGHFIATHSPQCPQKTEAAEAKWHQTLPEARPLNFPRQDTRPRMEPMRTYSLAHLQWQSCQTHETRGKNRRKTLGPVGATWGNHLQLIQLLHIQLVRQNHMVPWKPREAHPKDPKDPKGKAAWPSLMASRQGRPPSIWVQHLARNAIYNYHDWGWFIQHP